jgi:general secretion pathway protein K
MVTRGAERGVALIVVLWLLVVLGTIVTEVATKARLEAAMVSTLRSRTVARYAAESGVLVATARVNALLDSAPAPAQRIPLLRGLDERLAALHDVELGAARFGVTIVDLNSRIDLNRADEPTLRRLFSQFTVDSRAAVLAAALKQGPPLLRLGELSSLPGIDDSLALAVAPYVTVWGDGFVNINSASEPVLAALPNIGDAVARSIVRRRESGEVFLSPDPVQAPRSPDVFVPPAAPPAPLSAMPTRLLVISRGWQSGHPLTHEIQAVFAVVGQRLVLQSSRERDR